MKKEKGKVENKEKTCACESLKIHPGRLTNDLSIVGLLVLRPELSECLFGTVDSFKSQKS